MLIVVLSTTLVLAFSALVALYPSAIAPEVSAALGIPSSAIGLQVSLVFGGAMLTSLVGGPLTRRLGPCRASQTALLLLGAGAALMSVPSLLVAVVAALIVGLGYGMTNPSASVLLVRFTPPERLGFIFSLKQTGVPLGGMLAGALAPSLALGIGWRQGLWLLAGLASLGIIALQFKRHSWDDRREPGLNWRRSPLGGIKVVWAHKPLRYLAIVTLCFSTVQLSLSSFTVAMLVDDLDVSLIAAGAVMTVVQASGIAGRLWWGWIADRIGHRLMTLAIIDHRMLYLGGHGADLLHEPGVAAGRCRPDAWPVRPCGAGLEWRVPCRGGAAGTARAHRGSFWRLPGVHLRWCTAGVADLCLADDLHGALHRRVRSAHSGVAAEFVLAARRGAG